MKYLIDTNVLYYLSGVVKNDFPNWESIEKDILARDFYLSVWSLVELITTDSLQSGQKDEVFRFIAAKSIKILPTAIATRFPQMLAIDLSVFKEESAKDELEAIVLQEKQLRESELLRYTLLVGANVFFYALYLKLQNDGASKDALSFFAFLPGTLLEGNTEFLLETGSSLITEKYAGDKDSEIGSRVFSLLNILLYVLSLHHDSVVSGNPLAVFSSLEERLSASEIRKLSISISTNLLAEPITNRLNGNGSRDLRKLVPETYFDTAIQETTRGLKGDIPVGTLHFSLYLVRKSFFEGRKPLKNDMIDGVLFESYPQFRILTFDRKMKSIIKEFDSGLYDENQLLLQA